MKLSALFQKFMPEKNPSTNVGCSAFEVDKFAVSDFVLRRLVPVVGVTPFPLDELMLMVSTVCRVRPTHVFEWGTHVGKSARVFHETCKAFGIGAEIHSIDLPDGVDHVEHPKHRRGALVRGISEVQLHQGDGVETFLRLYAGCGEGCRPLVFVDGDHALESVRRELSAILSGVHEPCVLLHDTFFQSEASGYNVGPFEAIEEAVPSLGDRYQVIRLSLGLPGMTLLCPRSLAAGVR